MSLITGQFHFDTETRELTLSANGITTAIQAYYFSGGAGMDTAMTFHPEFVTDGKTGALVRIRDYTTPRDTGGAESATQAKGGATAVYQARARAVGVR